MTFTNKILLLAIRILKKINKHQGIYSFLYKSNRILRLNYPQNGKFHFVQVGANDGVSFDFLYDFLSEREPFGLVIEPVEEYFTELTENFKNFKHVKPVRLAVHRDLNLINIYKIKKSALIKYPDWVKGLASFSKTNLLKFDFLNEEDIETESVSAMPFMDIISKNLTDYDLDYLQLDTEGYDYEILKMVNFKIIRPKVIKLEIVNLNKDEQISVYDILSVNGYNVFYEQLDIVAIDLNFIRLI
jgi:FkbM family methyltransferase